MAFNVNLLTNEQVLKIYFNKWCREREITFYDLDNHPQIDDLILLIRIKEEFHRYMTKSHHALWGAIWDIVYNRKNKISEKNLKKLEKLTLECHNNMLYNDTLINKIHSLRQNTK